MKQTMKFASVLIGLMLFASVLAPVMAGSSGRAGKSNIGQLYLYQKDSNWNVVAGGAWGKMTYRLMGPTFDFIFNGHLLTPEKSYTLIYYPDPWPGTGLIVLGTAVADSFGNVHLAGSPNTGSLPSSTDSNAGAKIWLVLSSDYTVGVGMSSWNPAEYLFEDVGITYTAP